MNSVDLTPMPVATPQSLAIVDKTVSFIREVGGNPRITYNRGHIAVGTSGFNFCWFHPRRTATHCHFQLRVGRERRDAIVQQLEDAGISAGPHRRDSIKTRITERDWQENGKLLQELIAQAEQRSRSRGSEA